LQNLLLKVNWFKLLLSRFGETIYFIVNDQIMSSSEPDGSLDEIISQFPLQQLYEIIIVFFLMGDIAAQAFC